jgi:hypothetical protein
MCIWCTAVVWKCCKFLAVCGVGLMTHGKCHVDRPFPNHAIRCWVRTSPPSPPAVRHWSAYLTPFLTLYPQTPKRCHMDLWLACLVLIHLHRHRHDPSLLQQHLEFSVSDPSFLSMVLFSGGLHIALVLSSKDLFFSCPFLSEFVVRVAFLFSSLAPRLAALTTVSLEWQSDSPLALSFETLGLCWAHALPDQPPPTWSSWEPSDLSGLDQGDLLGLLQGLVGTGKFLTTRMTLSL